MPKLYKIFVFFIGLIAMSNQLHAQLVGYSFASSSADFSTKNIPAEWNLVFHPFGFKDVTNFTNFPNPATTQTTIRYTLGARATVNLKVIDLAGKQLAVLVKQDQAAGKQEYYWELAKNHITSGMYILVLQVDNKIFSRKVIVQ